MFELNKRRESLQKQINTVVEMIKDDQLDSMVITMIDSKGHDMHFWTMGTSNPLQLLGSMAMGQDMMLDYIKTQYRASKVPPS